MKKTFVIKGHHYQDNDKKYYTIERKILGIFSSKYIVPLLQHDDEVNDYIITYDEYEFSNTDKAVEVLQKLEEFYALNVPEVQILWDFEKDTYVYIPKNNLNPVFAYDEILNQDLLFVEPVDALSEYYEIEKHKKPWVEKTVMFKNGKMC